VIALRHLVSSQLSISVLVHSCSSLFHFDSLLHTRHRFVLFNMPRIPRSCFCTPYRPPFARRYVPVRRRIRHRTSTQFNVA
jgi:hypothetical protein